MIRLHTYAKGQVQSVDAPGKLAPPAGGARLWVEVTEPGPEELRMLVQGLGLHELSLADALQPEHPPKIEDFDDYLFFIAHTPSLDESRSTRKITVFLGRDWIVTLLRRPLPLLDEVLAAVRREPARYLEDPDFLAHRIVYVLNEGFEEAADGYLDQVEGLEDEAATNPSPRLMTAILEISREVGHFTRVVRNQREVCQALTHSNCPVLSKKVRPYLRDAYDQILHVYDLLEGLRDGLSSARVTHLSAVNNRLGDVMRTLTGIATVIMPLTLITGVFGMNFARIPGADTPAGFWITVTAILGLGGSLWLWFRRRHWL